jgi:hypothetical protein
VPPEVHESPSCRRLFEDPRAGSVYARNSDCTGGPCPRGLDCYPVEVRDDIAEANLNRFIKGPPRTVATPIGPILYARRP